MTRAPHAFRLFLLFALAGCHAAAPAVVGTPPPTDFEDVTARTGIDFTYQNGETAAENNAIVESLGGGVAAFDFDRDGLIDLYFPGGGSYAGSDGEQIVGIPGKLFRNLGDWKFRDVTAEMGLATLGGGKPWFYSHGVAVADTDRDGWADLLVTGYGGIALFRNLEGKKFQEVTAEAGLTTPIQWATGAAFGDLDGDGSPELYVCQYVDWSWANHPACRYSATRTDVCPPKQFSGLPDILYQNTPTGFRDVSREAGLLPAGPNASKGLGVLILDVDGDGRNDVYVANDTTPNFLYRNESAGGKIRLKEVGEASGTARDDRGMANGSMGLDAGDPSHLGRPDLWVTNYEHELPALYRNGTAKGSLQFRHASVGQGVGAIGQSYVGWGTAFLDADRDGWEDLVASHGHAIHYPQGDAANRPQLPLFLRNEKGRFRRDPHALGAYGAAPHNGRGMAIADLDNDGSADLIFSNLNEPATILRGTGGGGRPWIGLELVPKSNNTAVGSVVTLETASGVQTRYVKGGGSYCSANDTRVLFGFPDAAILRLEVVWPDGLRQSVENPELNRYHRIGQKAP